MNKRKIGSDYEAAAAEYMESLGMRIIEKNYRTRRGEIDIIAKDQDTLVFTEVKYRSDNASGYPEESVTRVKQGIIMKTAEFYILEKHYRMDTPCRFDVAAIYGDGSIRYYRNAFGGM